MQQINIGWAWTDITPQRPVFLAGQLYPRVSQYVQDPITATALALQRGEEQAVLISADMVSVPLHVLKRVRQALHGLDGLDSSRIAFSVTHTHNSSLFGPENLWATNEKLLGGERLPRQEVPADIFSGDEAADFLVEKISRIVEQAWLQRKPGGISSAQDYAAVAFNRRPLFGSEDKKEVIMYGDCSRDDFLGFEGTSDHAADMIYTWDEQGNLQGLVVVVSCPSQVYELHRMITADYWAATRRRIRAQLGPVPLLCLCGAAGDQNPLDLVRISKNNKETLPKWYGQTGEVQRNIDLTAWCEGIADRISGAVLRGYQQAVSRVERYPELRHSTLELDLPLRQVSEAEYLEANARLEAVRQAHSADNRLTIEQIVRLFEPMGVVARWQQMQETTTYRCSAHVLRIGQCALATNPFELFTVFGLRIKARSRAQQTLVVQLTDGNGGYLPSAAALGLGSYSSKPASTKCGPDGGERLVAETLAAIDRLWQA